MTRLATAISVAAIVAAGAVLSMQVVVTSRLASATEALEELRIEIRGATIMQEPDITTTANSKDDPPVVATIKTYCDDLPAEYETCSEWHAAKHREWENTCVRGGCE